MQPGVTYYYKLEDVGITGGGTLHGPAWATAAAQPPTFKVYLPVVVKP